MQKYIVLALITLGLTATGTAFAQDHMEKKEMHKKMEHHKKVVHHKKMMHKKMEHHMDHK